MDEFLWDGEYESKDTIDPDVNADLAASFLEVTSSASSSSKSPPSGLLFAPAARSRFVVFDDPSKISLIRP